MIKVTKIAKVTVTLALFVTLVMVTGHGWQSRWQSPMWFFIT